MQDMSRMTLVENLGIQFTRVTPDEVEGTMPVDHRTIQPYGVLHGGASAALAETLGSYGSHRLAAGEGSTAVGVELNINHLKGVRAGTVTGVARIIHKGRSSHVWSVEIRDEEGQLVAVSRLTVMILRKQG